MPENKNKIKETGVKNRTDEAIKKTRVKEVEAEAGEEIEAKAETGIEGTEIEDLIGAVEKEIGVGEAGTEDEINEAGTEDEINEAETENGINEAETEGVINEEIAVDENAEAGPEDIITEAENEDETEEEETGNKFKNVEIENNCKKTAKIYLEAARTAERVVAESYEDCVPGMQPSFPIDINLVARHYGIKVTSDELNQSQTQFSRVLALLICHEDDINVIVDNKVGYKTRRYAMANAIARYLLKDQGSVFTSSYAIPLIPQGLEEISADMVALFMLMPMQLFKEEFKDYIEKLGEHPMNVDKWLSHLSDRTQISPFNLAIGYQQMKTALCYERQLQLMENKYMDYDDDPYEMIFA